MRLPCCYIRLYKNAACIEFILKLYISLAFQERNINSLVLLPPYKLAYLPYGCH
jgi:hypothetical protein